MSLLEKAFEPFIIINKSIVPDGVGGTVTTWNEGAEIPAVSRLDSNKEARIAQQQGASATYTIVTRKSVVLSFHDVLKRKSDGKIFRITSNGEDNKTPDSASFAYREVNAEEWRLPV